ncbi:MAG: TorF family putative porin [Oxalobacteraceae bacterium]|jgi:uncharacterized protein (TIGR02001 family)|nr:TorF family putative porin [Oxalobacteraceae bacterium]
MKKLILASAVASVFVLHSAQVTAAEPAATPEHVVAYNVGVTTDYVFRGLSQSRNKPAVSAGVDYAHTPTGLYLGTWASTISWVADSYADSVTTANRGSTPYEVDFYGGIKGDIGAGLNYDVGAIYYLYPNHKLGSTPNANTVEVYGKIGYGPVYLKGSYALGDAVFTSDKAGSYYIDLGGDFPLAEGLVANAHYGMWRFQNGGAVTTASNYNYSDWKLGITKDLGNGLSGALAATGTNADKELWNFNKTGYLGGNKVIASLTKTF